MGILRDCFLEGMPNACFKRVLPGDEECFHRGLAVPGECKRLRVCRWANDERKKGRKPQICTYVGNIPIVCCPTSPVTPPTTSSTAFHGMTTKRPAQPIGGSIAFHGMTTKRPAQPVGGSVALQGMTTKRPAQPGGGSIAFQGTSSPVSSTGSTGGFIAPDPFSQRGGIARLKCREYSKYVYRLESSPVLLLTESVPDRVDKCAMSSDTLIVGGKETKPKEFPHMALIGYGDIISIEYSCGGSLISPHFILTAAHCLASPTKGKVKWVLLGEYDLQTEQDDDPQVIGVREAIAHPEYHPPAKYNDIALLRLAHDAVLNEFVRPACLHTEFQIRTNQVFKDPVATGWGHTDWGGESSDRLMKVNLPLYPHEKCKKDYSLATQTSLPQGLVDESQICAGGDGRDTCQGDSGGPLQMRTLNTTNGPSEPYCMYNIIGITSFGKACGFQSPGVYTRVYHYVPWIESIVWPSSRY